MTETGYRPCTNCGKDIYYKPTAAIVPSTMPIEINGQEKEGAYYSKWGHKFHYCEIEVVEK